MPAEELTMNLRTLSAAGAKLALGRAEEAANAKALAVSIAVVDVAGNLLAFQRLGNAPVTTIEAAIRKARTAASLGAPTKLFEDMLHDGMTSLLAFEFISPSQGGVPIATGGSIVGAIGCSGSSGEDDEAVASAGAAALVGERE